MKALLAVAIIAVVLVAAAAWAMASSKPAGSAYQVEVRDVAGVSTLTVTPEVVAAVPGHYVMPEVVVTSNMMPEVVVHARVSPDIAAATRPGIELVN
jgi:hypothetical protein